MLERGFRTEDTAVFARAVTVVHLNLVDLVSCLMLLIHLRRDLNHGSILLWCVLRSLSRAVAVRLLGEGARKFQFPRAIYLNVVDDIVSLQIRR